MGIARGMRACIQAGVREGHSGKPGVREGQTKPATPRIAPACKHTFKVQIFKIQNHPQNPQTEPATPGRVSARKHDAPVIVVAPDLPTKLTHPLHEHIYQHLLESEGLRAQA